MIKPLRDYVVLEKVPEEKKVGGIIIATSHENESAVAKVIAVGPGYVDEKGNKVTVQAVVGQKVIYKKYSTTDYDEGNTKMMLIQDKDILAVID
ncbi:MAG: co-chaperone GroES [Bacilli bacterium]|jgi:chaperonin GroES|nr:co-chaperone GroES [Bacilli bacterium]